jgi:hypothetical protein
MEERIEPVGISKAPSHRAIAVFFSVPIPMILAMGILNPSGSPPPLSIGIAEAIAAASAFFILSVLLFDRWLSTPAIERNTLREFIIFMVCLPGTAVVFGLFVHRDFFTAPFEFMISFSLIVFRGSAFRKFLSLARVPPESAKTGLIVYFVALTVWIGMVAYAIVIRTEPRWVECIFYNTYNLALAFLLLLVSLTFKPDATKTIAISTNRAFFGNNEITRLLGAQGLTILRTFIEKGNHLTCAQLRNCGEEGLCKVSACTYYRSIYNGILQLKNVLEVFELGTIEMPEEKSRVSIVGWHLSLSPGTRIEIR